jgi:biofilm PGA synthesis N-glycosyltransferase PgaC
VIRWRNRRLWPLALEAIASLAWVFAIAIATALAAAAVLAGGAVAAVLIGLAWGIAVALVATLQLWFAIGIELAYDRRVARAFLLGALYPVAYRMISAAAALRAQLTALVRGPAERRVVWDIPRERVAGR